jgi:co-chaperonin GroES (HSP10)
MNSMLKPSETISPLNKSGLHPLGRAVLVKPFEPEITQGKIIIPDHVKQGHQMQETRGVVIEVGPEAWRDELKPRAKPGDIVLVSAWSGVVLRGTADEEWYRMVNGDDVFCGCDDDVAPQRLSPVSQERRQAASKLQDGKVV